MGCFSEALQTDQKSIYRYNTPEAFRYMGTYTRQDTPTWCRRMLIFILLITVSDAAKPTFSVSPETFVDGAEVTVKCDSDDFDQTIQFKLGSVSKGGCSGPSSCGTGVAGYKPPEQANNFTTTMVIEAYNSSRDEGSWTCSHGGIPSDPFLLRATISQTLSTYFTSTLEVTQSSLLVSTDGGINSLNSLTNLPNGTTTFSSNIPTEAETFHILSAVSLYRSLYYTSNTYTTAFLMTTLTSIFDDVISLSFSSSLVPERSNIKSSFLPIIDTITSDLAMFKTKSIMYSSVSAVDVLESSNFISPSKTYPVDSTNGIGVTNGYLIPSSVNSDYMSRLQSLTAKSFFESQTHAPQSQTTTKLYGSLLTLKGTRLHIDYTLPTPFTFTVSLEISFQSSPPPLTASYLTRFSSQTLDNHITQPELNLTIISTTPSNTESNSMISTTFTIDDASTLYSSSDFFTSVDFKSSFDFNAETKGGTNGTSTSTMIETMTFNIIAKSIKTKSAKRSTNRDFSSNILINSPIPSIGIFSGTPMVRPTIVGIRTSMDNLLNTFENGPSKLNVNSFNTWSSGESKTVGIIMSTSNKSKDTDSSWNAPSSSLKHMHSLPQNSGDEAESLIKTISSDNSILFDSFSISREKDSKFILSTTPDLVLKSRDVSRTSLERQSYVGSFSTAYISSKNELSISVNSDGYVSKTNVDLSKQMTNLSTIFSSVPQYFYSSNIDKISSSLLVSTSLGERSVLTYDSSLSKTTKLVAITVTVAGCILFVVITVLVLFALNLIQCQPHSKGPKNNTAINNTDSNCLSGSNGVRREVSLFDKTYGLPTRYYDNTATSWCSNEDQFTSNYNKNWDDI